MANYFDFMDDDETGSLLSTAPPAVSPLELSGGGSILGPGVDAKKRGKKTRIPIHRIKPVTALDKGKLEALGKQGDPSIEDLEKWGIKYEVGPESAGKGGVGVAPEAMLGNVRDPNKTIQGNLGDIPRLAKKGLETAGAAAALTNPQWIMAQAGLELMKGRIGQPKSAPLATPPPTGDQPLNLPEPKEDTIIGASEAAGVPGKDFTDGMVEIAKKLGLDLDTPVQFPLALQRLLNSSEFGDLRPDFDALGAAAGEGEKSTPQTEEQMAGPGGKKTSEPQKARNLHAESLGLMTKLAQTRDINTWGEAIAFVLLSMLIKPQMAILFFSKASERGTLKAQYADIQRQIKESEMAKADKRQRDEWNRRKAVDIQLRGAEEGWKREESKTKFVRDWFMLKQKAALSQKRPSTDPVSKKIQEDIDNWMNLAAKEAQLMDEKKARAYMQKAEELMERKRQWDASQFGAGEEAEE